MTVTIFTPTGCATAVTISIANITMMMTIGIKSIVVGTGIITSRAAGKNAVASVLGLFGSANKAALSSFVS